MKPFVATVILSCSLIVASSALQAQGVYVTPGEKGPVFSDKPQPGAKEVNLRPLSVVPSTKDSRPAAPPAKAPAAMPAAEEAGTGIGQRDFAASSYSRFMILSPEDGGSVVANTGVFEVRVAVDPTLQLGEGHAVLVSINGRPVTQRFTASDFTIPPEFWRDSLPPPNQLMQLDASIVDVHGYVLKRAVPVRFYMRRATVLNHPRRPVTRPIVLPQAPTARPKPVEADSAVGATMKKIDR